MYLKKLELTGFKSFKDKRKIEFTNDITAVVGPNGSGKSNVVDAIRWVLGEQNAKNLRGGKMEDVIFSGAETKKPLGLASVSLTLDNSGGGYKLPFDEVVVTRRLYRSGESEYLINGNTCRLKDITELFMDTGLGRDGYSIIGQGDIESLLNSSQRKTIFEEAAGINKYKTRRDQSLHTLEKEKENIVRLNDIIREIESTLPSLKTGSEKAAAYLKLHDELKGLRINLFLQDEKHILAAIEEKEDQLKIIKNQMIDEVNQKNAYEKEHKAYQQQLEDLKMTEKKMEDAIVADRLKVKEIESSINIEQERIKNMDTGMERVDMDIDKLQLKINSSNERQAETPDVDFLTKIEAKENQLITLETNLKEKEISLEKLDQIENQLKNDTYKLSVLDGYDNYNRAIQRIFENKDELTGIVDTVGKLIKIPPKLQIAIEITLGGAMGHVVVETDKDAKMAIEFLKRTKSGRATFLPIASIKSREQTKKYPTDPAILGFAKDLIDYDPKLERVMNQLFSDVIIVDNIDNATRLSKQTSFRITTLAGEVISKSGSITGGSTHVSSRTKEVAELKGHIEQLQEKRTKLTGNDSYKDYVLAEKVEIATLKEQMNDCTVSIASLRQEQAFYFKLQNERDEQKKTLEGELEALIEEKDKISHSKKQKIRDISALSAQMAETNADISRKITEKEALITQGAELIDLGKSLEEKTKHYTELMFQLKTNEQKISHDMETLTEKKANMHQQIWEAYEITYRQALAYQTDDLSLDQMRKLEKEKREQVKALGHVNVEAIEQYREVKTRYDFLSTQKKDIEDTIEKLMQMIDKLTIDMETQFKQNIKEISVRFAETFKKMFGGGSASLKISADDDILNANIEIVAQPPEKKLQSLNLMSLGEKTLTAISLLFAMVGTRPSPFLLLDEIEAPLDYANNLKFANYIKTARGSIQFILITHKKLTMEAAHTIYGITMQGGVSAPVSMKLED